MYFAFYSDISRRFRVIASHFLVITTVTGEFFLLGLLLLRLVLLLVISGHFIGFGIIIGGSGVILVLPKGIVLLLCKCQSCTSILVVKGRERTFSRSFRLSSPVIRS